MSFMDLVKSVAPFAGPTAGIATATKDALTKKATHAIADELHEALSDAPEAPDPHMQHVSGMGASAPTRAQWIALTAVAATQPKNLPSFLKSQGLQLTKADLARLQGAAKNARAIMSHPQYQKLQVNTKVLSKISGQVDAAAGDEMGSFFGALGKVLTAPLAATALAASALTWGVNHVVLAPAKLVGKISNWGARKAGWSVPGYGGARAPAARPGWPTMPSQYIPPPMSPPGAPPAVPQDMSAYYARAQAAQQQSLQAQQQLAATQDASDAEAQALEAEEQARADQRAAMQAQFDIPPGDDQMGNARGGRRMNKFLDFLDGDDGTSSADATLAKLSSSAGSKADATLRRMGTRSAAMGAWIRKRGQARPTLVVGFDRYGRATIY